MSKPTIPLRKIAEIRLGTRVYALGKNGHYLLVDESEMDAWGHPIAQVINTGTIDPSIIQELLDSLGEALEKIKSMELERSRRLGQGAE